MNGKVKTQIQTHLQTDVSKKRTISSADFTAQNYIVHEVETKNQSISKTHGNGKILRQTLKGRQHYIPT